jgi:hypothetical protein
MFLMKRYLKRFFRTFSLQRIPPRDKENDKSHGQKWAKSHSRKAGCFARFRGEHDRLLGRSHQPSPGFGDPASQRGPSPMDDLVTRSQSRAARRYPASGNQILDRRPPGRIGQQGRLGQGRRIVGPGLPGPAMLSHWIALFHETRVSVRWTTSLNVIACDVVSYMPAPMLRGLRSKVVTCASATRGIFG